MRYMIYILCLWTFVCVLCSCGGTITESPHKAYNMRIWTEEHSARYVTTHDVERVIYHTALAFSQQTGWPLDMVMDAIQSRPAWIGFVDNPIPCDAVYLDSKGDKHKASTCSGLYTYTGSPRYLEVWVRLDSQQLDKGFCLPLTSLSHELVHLMQDKMEGEHDYYHQDPRLFNYKDSAERLGQFNAGEELCPWLFTD